ncbi:Thiolase, N-terminal domain [Gordonia westfalica]|uniref:Thiolase, N-terminal domain n=1 Tax=Gordonia westfalica TaxID=158898 RepID=A0A1H2LHE8_9ACTN|nr:Thiolase, N-terminal domain [Gordonia westfalica]
MTVNTTPPAADDVVICEPLRTPVGRYGGSFVDVPATDLAATVISELVRRTAIDPERIDDVVFGQCYPNGEAPAIGRVAALDAGLPVTVPGSQLDRRCGSGLQAVLDAAMRVQTGVADLVIAGGVESMSRAEYYTESMRWGAKGAPAALHDRLARGRVTAGGRTIRSPAGCSRPRRTFGASTRSRGRSRTNWPSNRIDVPWPPSTAAGSRKR